MRRIKLSSTTTLSEAIRLIRHLQKEYPDREVYFDGERMEVVVDDTP